MGNACYHSVQKLLSSRLLPKTIKIRIYKTIILPMVLYGSETWSLTLRVFENRMLRRISGPMRNEVTGCWRKLHNEELHNLYSSPSIVRTIKSRKMRLAGHVAWMGEKRNAYRILVGNSEGKRPLGRPRRGWTILKWILERQNGMGLIGLIWLRIGTSVGPLWTG
jgi:hypothetical protein